MAKLKPGQLRTITQLLWERDLSFGLKEINDRPVVQHWASLDRKNRIRGTAESRLLASARLQTRASRVPVWKGVSRASPCLWRHCLLQAGFTSRPISSLCRSTALLLPPRPAQCAPELGASSLGPQSLLHLCWVRDRAAGRGGILDWQPPHTTPWGLACCAILKYYTYNLSCQ